MIVRIKRSWFVYVSYAVVVLLYSNRAFFPGHERSLAAWIAILALETYMLMSFASVLVNRDYMLIGADSITIFRDVFKKESISRESVNAIELSESPFGHDYFVLKDGKKISFRYYSMTKTQFEKLKETLNVPVV